MKDWEINNIFELKNWLYENTEIEIGIIEKIRG